MAINGHQACAEVTSTNIDKNELPEEKLSDVNGTDRSNHSDLRVDLHHDGNPKSLDEGIDSNDYSITGGLHHDDKNSASHSSEAEVQISKEEIDIDDFLIRSGECGRYQLVTIIKMMLISFPLAYTPFIFYFIGVDPHWVNMVNGTFHSREDNRRCTMNTTQWQYDYDKTTMTTEFNLICDDSWKLSLLGSVVFIGWAFGSFFLGFLSDKYGRKAVMMPCLFMDLFCLLLHGFVNSYWALIIIRLLMGFFHAAPALNAYVLIVELIGPNYRVLAANVGGAVWGIATSLLALKAFLIDDWRILCIAASAPYFIFIVLGIWFPESVRWLNANGRVDEAEKILRDAANTNKRPVKNVTLKQTQEEHTFSYIDLFNTCKVAKITLSQGVIWLALGMVYYTMSWAFADLGGDLYLNFVLASLVELPMHAVAVVGLQSYGRKRTVLASLAITAVASLVIVVIILIGQYEVLKLVFGLIAKSSVSLAFISVYMWSSEIFPTVVRTQGLGFTLIASRLGAAISPFTNNLDLVHPTLPFIVMLVSIIVALLCCFCLPETLGKPTRERFEELYNDEE